MTCRLLPLPLLVIAPRSGGLYSGYYAIQAAQRYGRYWTAVLRTQPVGKGSAAILPPLDVAYAWCVSASTATAPSINRLMTLAVLAFYCWTGALAFMQSAACLSAQYVAVTLAPEHRCLDVSFRCAFPHGRIAYLVSSTPPPSPPPHTHTPAHQAGSPAGPGRLQVRHGSPGRG